MSQALKLTKTVGWSITKNHWHSITLTPFPLTLKKASFLYDTIHLCKPSNMKVVGNSVNLAPLLSCQSLKTVLTGKWQEPTIQRHDFFAAHNHGLKSAKWNMPDSYTVRWLVLQHPPKKKRLCGVTSSYLFNETLMSRSNYHKLPEIDQASATPASAAASRINASCDIKSEIFCNAPWLWFDDVWCSQDAIIIKSSSPLSFSSSSLEDKSCNVAGLTVTCWHVEVL